MDVMRLLELAGKMNIPGLVSEGISFVEKVKANARSAKHALTDADIADLDAIHAETMRVNDELISKADQASR